MSPHRTPLWQHCESDQTNVAKFITYVNEQLGLSLKTYDDLYSWSVGDATFQDFWRAAYQWLELAPPGSKPVGPMLADEHSATTPLFPPPAFFAHDSLNIAELLLRDGKDQDVAIHFAREDVAGVVKVTWRTLRERVRETRDALDNSGIRVGDMVVAVMSNSVDTIVICLAALSLGAVWSSSSPDLGPAAITDRYMQINPKIVFADDGYLHRGQRVSLADRIRQWSEPICQAAKSLRDIVVVPFCKLDIDTSKIHRGCSWDSFISRTSGQELTFNLQPFSHPAFAMFSSGTTGKAKCIIHSSGTSWVMWVLNLLNLSSGKSMLLYEGSPFHPEPTILLKLAQEVGVMTSTGSALSADLYDWFYETAFPPRTQLISMSGGTDIAGCFVGGTPLLPVYSGEIQVKALGMAVDILDPGLVQPRSVELSGLPGELVCRKPFPSQPVSFHGPAGADVYRSSYFERFGPRIWCQGDLIQRLPDTGGIVMLGRSDGVLNPSGVRFGSAEIYAVTDTFPEIADSLCVGQKRVADADERVLLFLKMHPGSPYTEELEGRIKAAIRSRYSHRHVPQFIFPVADIPYTMNGKKCEINVKHVVSGRQVAVSGTVANPDSLRLYRRFQDLPLDKKATIGAQSKL
ncbi:hypothetical protein MRS44_016144 [Fusarium solani]|uniref:uncharacterized protein n=1 Tax=Fusarium solani TaxID=169388 RepID=UPI0032C48413|nr:hypothetical protein MRS44_016144 [Fusarium solani]